MSLFHTFVCPKRWVDLEGAGPARHCGECRKDVVDLSRLTEQEAETYVSRHPDTCGRTLRTAGGRWVQRPTWRRLTQVFAASMLVTGRGGCGPEAPPVPQAVDTPPDLRWVRLATPARVQLRAVPSLGAFSLTGRSHSLSEEGEPLLLLSTER